MAVQPSVPNTICYCTDDQHYNCSIDELGPVYPGQTLKFDILVINITENSIEIFADKMHPTSCGSHSAEEDMLLFSGICTKMEYKSILHKDDGSCNILFSAVYYESHSKNFHYFWDTYHITILS